MSQQSNPILHDPYVGKFYTNDGTHLLYSRIQDILSIDHVFVPDQLRGQNRAGRLIKKAVAYSESIGTKVRPVCSFANSYLQARHEFHNALEHPPSDEGSSIGNSSQDHD